MFQRLNVQDQVLVNCVSGESSLPGLQTAAFLLQCYSPFLGVWGWGTAVGEEWALCCLLLRGYQSYQIMTSFNLNYFLTPNTATIETKTSTWEFGGHIHSVHMPYKRHQEYMHRSCKTWREGSRLPTQGGGLRRNQPRWHLDLGLSAFETVKKINVCCLNCPACGILLWKP